MEAAARVSATEKQRRALARAKEIERAKKVEKSRSETEKLLAKQQEEVERKKVAFAIQAGALSILTMQDKQS